MIEDSIDTAVKHERTLKALQAVFEEQVLPELGNAVRKFPYWPNNPHAALDILNEESGELTKAINEFINEPGKGTTVSDIEKEAVQTAAMGIRFLLSIRKYDFKKSEEHSQSEIME